MSYDSAMKWLKEKNFKQEEFDPSKMTDEEIAQLRFTFISPEQAEEVKKELKKRGIGL